MSVQTLARTPGAQHHRQRPQAQLPGAPPSGGSPLPPRRRPKLPPHLRPERCHQQVVIGLTRADLERPARRARRVGALSRRHLALHARDRQQHLARRAALAKHGDPDACRAGVQRHLAAVLLEPAADAAGAGVAAGSGAVAGGWERRVVVGEAAAAAVIALGQGRVLHADLPQALAGHRAPAGRRYQGVSGHPRTSLWRCNTITIAAAPLSDPPAQPPARPRPASLFRRTWPARRTRPTPPAPRPCWRSPAAARRWGCRAGWRQWSPACGVRGGRVLSTQLQRTQEGHAALATHHMGASIFAPTHPKRAAALPHLNRTSTGASGSMGAMRRCTVISL